MLLCAHIFLSGIFLTCRKHVSVTLLIDSCVRYCGIRDGLSRIHLVRNIDTSAQCSLWNALISIVGQSPCRQTETKCVHGSCTVTELTGTSKQCLWVAA
jgi:hypothetical protein